MTVGSKINELRKENNMSQEELAIRVNVSRQTVSKWENDVVLPDVYNLKQLAKVLHCSVDEIINDETVQPKDNLNHEKDGPVVEAMKYGENIVKRHWQKIGYYLIYTGGGMSLFGLIASSVSNSFFKEANNMMNGFGFTGTTITSGGVDYYIDGALLNNSSMTSMPGQSTFNMVTSIPLMIGLVTLMVGIGLVIYDFSKKKQ